MKRVPAVVIAVSLVACATSRPPASPAAEPSSSAAAPGSELVPAAPLPEPEGDAQGPTKKPLLVSRAVLESGHLEGGGNVLTIIVTRTGEVVLESRRWSSDGKVQGPTVHPCPALSTTELAELGRRVDGAQAAIGSASYSTSSGPPPTANYSRSETYRFSPTARFPEVSVAGWADLPRALSELGSELARLQASCDS